jgi:hypothetical protein
MNLHSIRILDAVQEAIFVTYCNLDGIEKFESDTAAELDVAPRVEIVVIEIPLFSAELTRSEIYCRDIRFELGRETVLESRSCIDEEPGVRSEIQVITEIQRHIQGHLSALPVIIENIITGVTGKI